MRRVFLSVLLAGTAYMATSEVEFKGLDLSSGGELLFTAQTDLPGLPPYDTLFVSDVKKGTLAQLTCYPEEVTLLDSGSILQIQNRFGVFRADLTVQGTPTMKPVAGFPSFIRGSQIQAGKILTAGSSPNGNWLLYVVPTSEAHGRLMLLEVGSGRETTIAQDMEYSINSFPAAWAWDSSYFIYEKGARLYYYSVAQFAGSRVAAEAFRFVGKGKINTVRWSKDGKLYYINENLLYRISPGELFTRTLYTGLIAVGEIIGKLPFPYDVNFDTFHVSPDGGKMLFNKEGRNLFLFYVNPEDYTDSGKTASLPYLFLPGSTTVLSVHWPSTDVLTVVTSKIENGARTLGAFRLEVPKDRSGLGLTQTFRSLDTQGARKIEMSPDETMLAVILDSGVSVLKYSDWKPLQAIKFTSPLSVLWRTNEELVIAGSKTTETFSLTDKNRRFVSLSQADEYGFSGTGKVAVKSGGMPFTGSADGNFAGTASYEGLTGTQSRETMRVYLDSAQSGSYRNTIMVRSMTGMSTAQLILPQSRKYQAFPAKDEDRIPGLFDHGSRIRRREVSLVFNCIDTPNGLTHVLNTLKDYGIKATFFVNGEFIRRNPGAVREIAASGHEAGSMFFANFDMTDARFNVDAEFVKRGLARNEDDYFRATSKELSLLWHAPNYVISDSIIKAGAAMNYSYVGRDLDPLDWVSENDSHKMPGSYVSAHKTVESLMKRKLPGSIIPVRIGIPEGGRMDYLFNELDLLINALMQEGYVIVPVTTLMEHVK